MGFVNLGGSGLKVSRVCLGTMTLGREADEAASLAIMDYFVEQGHNFLDTANAYSRGRSEQIVGRWMKERGNRSRVIIATKVYGRMGEGPNEAGLSRIHIRQAVEDSLRRLQTDVIDLYQIHRWDPEAPPEETLEALSDLVRQGKVRYIGCSNLAAWQLAKYMRVAERRHLVRFVSLQPVYNALNRSIEAELLPLCADEDMGVLSYNPLAGGFLTGKYERGREMPAAVRLADSSRYYERYYTEAALDVAERFVASAKERSATPAQLALAWVLAEPRVTCPIIGARTLEQLEDSLGGLAVVLTPEERERIPAVPPCRWVGLDPVYDRERIGL